MKTCAMGASRKVRTVREHVIRPVLTAAPALLLPADEHTTDSGQRKSRFHIRLSAPERPQDQVQTVFGPSTTRLASAAEFGHAVRRLLMGWRGCAPALQDVKSCGGLRSPRSTPDVAKTRTPRRQHDRHRSR